MTRSGFDSSRTGPSFRPPAQEILERKRLTGLRTLGFSAGRAGRPPSERFADDPVYMAAYRNGQKDREA